MTVSGLTLNTSFCKAPPAVKHATYSGSNKYGDTVKYRCQEGYAITAGDFVLNCQPDGTWKGSLLTCTKSNFDAHHLV